MDKIQKRMYTREFRVQAVAQVLKGGRTAVEVAKSLDINDKTFPVGSGWPGRDG